MSNETLTTTETRPEVVTKMAAWASIGRIVHDANINYQVKMQASIAKLIRKPGRLLVTDAENALKEVKKELTDHTPERIKITSKFDAVKSQLSSSERLWKEAINAAAAELLIVKQEIKKEEDDAKLKTDELKRIREALMNRISEVDAGYKSMIAVRITDAYERALNGEAPTEDTRAFISAERAWATEEMFTMKQSQPKPTYTTPAEVEALWTELKTSVQPASFYTALFVSELDTKFEFYTIALKHKESSIAASKAKQAETLASITKEKDLAAAGARLETVATTYTAMGATGAKALKQKWEVKMEDDLPSALAIISAFVGSIETCKGDIRATWMNVSVEQMAKALAWAKNKDERFTVSGINFVSVDKL